MDKSNKLDNYEDDILAVFTRRFAIAFQSEEYSSEDVFLYDCASKILHKLHEEFGYTFTQLSEIVTSSF